MKLWLDDIREMPAEFNVCVRTANEAIEILKTGKVTLVSLDHDLGTEETGYTVALFIEQSAFEGTIPQMELRVHSQNGVGVKNIIAAFNQAKKFWNCY